jgi:formylglycine-generating enzyme required for sulfatase activity
VAATGKTFSRLAANVPVYTVPAPAGFVYVAAGTLPSSSLLSGQSVAAFYIAQTETTWGQWQSVRTYAAANGYDIGSAGAGSGTDYPVTNVSWFEVAKWCNACSEQDGLTPVYRVNNLVYKTGDSTPTMDATANGYRLPTEAQWEFAARGGVSTQNYEYSGSNEINAVAWYVSNSGNATHAVGTKLANELGVSDMTGNVWEWCESWYPGSEGSIRVFRGGGWGGNAGLCRVAYRDNVIPSYSDGNIGFRVARSSGQ